MTAIRSVVAMRGVYHSPERRQGALTRSTDDAAAHDASGVAGHKGRGIGREKQAGIRDVFRSAQSAEWDLLQLLRRVRRGLAKLGVPLLVASLGIDEAGHDHVGPDPERPELSG